MSIEVRSEVKHGDTSAFVTRFTPDTCPADEPVSEPYARVIQSDRRSFIALSTTDNREGYYVQVNLHLNPTEAKALAAQLLAAAEELE